MYIPCFIHSDEELASETSGNLLFNCVTHSNFAHYIPSTQHHNFTKGLQTRNYGNESAFDEIACAENKMSLRCLPRQLVRAQWQPWKRILRPIWFLAIHWPLNFFSSFWNEEFFFWLRILKNGYVACVAVRLFGNRSQMTSKCGKTSRLASV